MNQLASVITSILNNVIPRTGNVLTYKSYKTQKIIHLENRMHASEDTHSTHVWMADFQISWGATMNMTLYSLYG